MKSYNQCKNDDQFEIVYATHNADLFIESGYIPKTWPDCEESFSKSLDVLVWKICQYLKGKKSFPKLLILKDHIAVNIVFEYMYSFEKEFQEKLVGKGVIGVTACCVLATGGRDGIAIVEKVRECYPNYELDNLRRHREVEYMEPDDKRWNYLVYKLESDAVAEKAYFLQEEKRLEELRCATQSPKWDYYYNLIQQAPGEEIKGCPHDMEFPMIYDGQTYEIILSNGKISQATVIGDCTWSNSGLEWKTVEGKELGACYSYRVIAWKKIIQ